MKIIERKKYINLWDELSNEKRMIFLAGPRQSGKTTLAKEIAMKYKNFTYFNWDILSDKKKIIENPAFFENINRFDDSFPLVILDEIHKYKNWKNYLKGIYDQFNSDYLFLISGSGRLDIYQKGGDSLAGRYLMFHLFPFTVSELSAKNRNFTDFYKNPTKDFNINDKSEINLIWKNLSKLSGFPEPYVKGKATFWAKWSKNYLRQLIYEDIRNIIQIKNINDVDLLFSLLPSKVGNTLSINSLARDIGVSFDTVKNWLNIFDNAYLTFKISPWSKRISRSILKEKKLYFFNYPIIANNAVKFENMIALELLKAITAWNEKGLGDFTVHYIKNKEKEEVDFLIADKNNPFLLIEAKNSDLAPSKPLIKFQNELNIPAVQLINKENIYKIISNNKNKIVITSASQWLSSLP